MIEIKGLTKLFKNGHGINGASFDVKDGTICGIVGDNGAGKSTLIKTIFEEYISDSGTVLYDGKDIYKTGDIKKFSFFPDQSVFPSQVSLLDFAIYASTLNGLSSKESRQKALEIFKSVNLGDYVKKTFSALSAGMQKRALLAISLVTNPEVIVLDEPTANLDVKTRIQFLELLLELKKMGKTILISTHLIDELETIADQVVVIESGKITYSGKVERNTDLRKIYKEHTNQNENIDIARIKETQGQTAKEGGRNE